MSNPFDSPRSGGPQGPSGPTPTRTAPALAAAGSAGHHRDRPGPRLHGAQRLRVLLDRAPVVPLGRLRRGLHDPAADAHRPVLRLRRPDGRDRRRRDGDGLPLPPGAVAGDARHARRRHGPLPRAAVAADELGDRRRRDRDGPLRRRVRDRPVAQLLAVAPRPGLRHDRPLLREGRRLLRLRAAVLALPRRLRDGAGGRRPDRHGRHQLPLRRHPPVREARRPAHQRGADPGVGAAGPLRAGQGRRLLARPLRPGDQLRLDLHRHGLHRRQGSAPGQGDPRRDRRGLRGALPGQHLASHVAAALGRGGPVRPVGDHPRTDRAVGRPGDPGQPQRAGPRGSLHQGQHRRDARRVPARPGRAAQHERHGDRGRRSPAGARRDHLEHPPRRPADRQRDLRAAAAGAGLLLGARRARRRPLRDRRHGPRRGARRARARPERTRRGRPELVQPPHRLHARQRCHRCLRQPASRGRLRPAERDPVGRGRGGRRGRAEQAGRPGRLRDARLLRRAEPQLQHRRPAPGRYAGGVRPAAGRPERGGRRDDLQRRGGGADRRPRQPAALRGELQRAQPAAVEPGARELQDPLQPQPAPDGREGRPMAHGRLRPVPGRRRRPDPVDPRRLHRHRQVPALAARVARGR